MVHDVFIGYNSRDTLLAEKICKELEVRDILCWFSQRDVMPGTIYSESIFQAIEESKVCLFLLSYDNEESWYKMQFEHASKTKKYTLPIIFFSKKRDEIDNITDPRIKEIDNRIALYETVIKNHIKKITTENENPIQDQKPGWQEKNIIDTATYNLPEQLIKSIQGCKSGITSLALTAGESILVAGYMDGIVDFIDIINGTTIKSIEDNSSINTIAMTPDDKKLIAGCKDEIKIWDTITNQLIATLSEHTGNVNSIAVSPDGGLFASGGWDGEVFVWDAKTLELQYSLTDFTGSVLSVVFSPDGRKIGIGGGDEKIILWDSKSGQMISTFVGHTDSVLSLAFSPDSRLIASCSSDSTVILWNVFTGEKINTLSKHESIVTSISFSSCGKYIVSADVLGRIIWWDVITGLMIHTFLQKKSGSVMSMVLRRDRTLITGSTEGIINVWQMPTMAPLCPHLKKMVLGKGVLNSSDKLIN